MEKRKQTQSIKLFKKKSKIYINSTLPTKGDQSAHFKSKITMDSSTKESFGLASTLKKHSGSKNKDKKIGKGKIESISHTQLLKMNNFNGRCVTETNPSKNVYAQQLQKKQKYFRNYLSPQRKTIKKGFKSNSNKERLSLSSNKKERASSLGQSKVRESQLNVQSLTDQQLIKIRAEIQKQIKTNCLKSVIHKKDLIKITNKYQRLIDRLVFTELDNSQNLLNFQTKYFAGSIQHSCREENQMATVREIKENKNAQPIKKVKDCPKLQLGNVRKLQIDDYHDQFMSHYDQLSQSWKRDINNQRRF